MSAGVSVRVAAVEIGEAVTPATALLAPQVTVCFDTGPLIVGGANVHWTVSTMVGGGCSTMMVALVNCRSVIASVQLGSGQSGAPGIGLVGGRVVTLNDTVPFLISEAGSDRVPATDTGARFWPGGCCWPDGLVQVAIGFARAVRKIVRSWFPRPPSAANAVKVNPLSPKDAPD